jgi:hypothetical protein
MLHYCSIHTETTLYYIIVVHILKLYIMLHYCSIHTETLHYCSIHTETLHYVTLL